MTRSKAKSIDRLPQEILLQILSKLPISSLMQCKLVSKAWKTLISDPILPHLFDLAQTDRAPGMIFYTMAPLGDRLYWFNLSSFPDSLLVKPIPIPPILSHFSLEASCNGLICLRDYFRNNSLHVYNPFTRSHLQLPRPTGDKSTTVPIIAIGFLEDTREFKILRMTPTGDKRSDVKILTIGTCSWRYLGNVPYKFEKDQITPLVNGNLHWLNGSIISFNLETEEFKEIQIPYFNVNEINLSVFRGKLSIIVAGLYRQWSLWVMDEYGVEESWRQNFRYEVERLSFNDIKYLKVVCVMENGELLLECHKDSRLIVFDPRFRRVKRFRVNVDGKTRLRWAKSVVHVGCLNGIS